MAQTTEDMRIALPCSPNDLAFGRQLLHDLQRRLADVAHIISVPLESDAGGVAWDDVQQLVQTCGAFAIVLSLSALASPCLNAKIDLAWRGGDTPKPLTILATAVAIIGLLIGSRAHR